MRPCLVTLTLVLLLFSAGCAKDIPAGNDRADKKGKTVMESNEAGLSDKGASSQAPEVVVKTENQVSSQEASAMLDEVDKQLSDLLGTLERMDDVDDQYLQY